VPEIDKDPSAAANKVADTLDADVLLFNGHLDAPEDNRVIDFCQSYGGRPNAFLVLVTHGGDADAAYRMARCLQRKYKKLIVCISGVCMSAGTLAAIAGHEIVMSDHGQLGPLDVQVYKKDELMEMSSGLTGAQALSALQTKAFETFQEHLLALKIGSSGTITLKTAMEIASKLTTGLFAPIYEQIEPMKLGEDARAMMIAEHYGERLNQISRNLKRGGLEKLLASYPSHGFVIDREEAETLFERVRKPSAEETELIDSLGSMSRSPKKGATIRLISQNRSEKEHEAQQSSSGDSEGTGATPSEAAQDTGREPLRDVAPVAGAEKRSKPPLEAVRI
jgi:hypothetical protein